MKTATLALEALVLVPLALIHCLLLRLDRWLWPAPVPPTPTAVVTLPCRTAPPAMGRQAPALADLTVVELRRLAQARGIRSIAGTRASKARRAALLEVLA